MRKLFHRNWLERWHKLCVVFWTNVLWAVDWSRSPAHHTKSVSSFKSINAHLCTLITQHIMKVASVLFNWNNANKFTNLSRVKIPFLRCFLLFFYRQYVWCQNCCFALTQVWGKKTTKPRAESCFTVNKCVNPGFCKYNKTLLIQFENILSHMY